MQAERFLTTAEAADLLGMGTRAVYALMQNGDIESVCINPGSTRKQYRTTESRIAAWQRRAFVQPKKKKRQIGADANLWEIDKDGNRRIARKRAAVPAAAEG